MSSRHFPTVKNKYWRVRIKIRQELQDLIKQEAKTEDRHYSFVISRALENYYDEKREN